jgi:hypothetical protein
MKKALKIAGVVMLAVFIAMQFYRPERTNPPVDPARTIQAILTVPADADAILRRSCYDCHSHETRWPWYSHIAPAMWLVASDVENGRSMLNFSQWDYRALRAIGRLDQMAMEIDAGNMPLPAYLLMHPSARLSEEEKDKLYDWIDAAREEILNDTTGTK